MVKVDLHTHSIASPDGAITAEEYASILRNKKLDYIAVTDHDRIDFALHLHQKIGPQIIVGQEITTSQGELIGLFLTRPVQTGLSARDTALAIKAQHGLVYVPHPFETVRKGIDKGSLEGIAGLVDIVEGYNGRAFFQNKGPQAATWAKLHNKPIASSSDAHGVRGLHSCFVEIAEAPTAKNLAKQLLTGLPHMSRPPMLSLLYPKVNRLRGTLGHKKP